MGLTTSRPSMRPTRTQPTGPAWGMSLIARASDAPVTARVTGSFSWSVLITVATTCTSLRKSLGKSGRSGRSIRRQARMAASVGRPSRRGKLPGMRPAAYSFSS